MIANRLVGLAKNRPELNARVPNGVMHELSKLYVDVVGVTTPGALQAVLDIVPMSHLLFGTDFPFWAPETTIKGLAGLKLSAADLQAIERDNALKLAGCCGRAAATWSASARLQQLLQLCFQNFACRVVPWPRVSSLAGISRACRSSRASAPPSARFPADCARRRRN